MEVDTSTEFSSAGLTLRRLLACQSYCDAGGTGFSRTDFLIGYRYLDLAEHLVVRDPIVSLQSQFPIAFDVVDTFNTRNTFQGLDLGMAWQTTWRKWSVDLMLKTAIGTVKQEVGIAGATAIDQLGAGVANYPGGLLALPSNMGSYSRNRWTVVPELGANARFAILPRLHAMIGYSLVYWSSVVRPGEQIDRDINPDQLPPPIVPMAGAHRPEFSFQETDYW